MAFPLSAVRITRSYLSCRFLTAVRSCLVIFEAGGLAFFRMLHTPPLRSLAALLSSFLAALSTPAIMSTYEILLGAGAKFRPRHRTSSVFDSS